MVQPAVIVKGGSTIASQASRFADDGAGAVSKGALSGTRALAKTGNMIKASLYSDMHERKHVLTSKQITSTKRIVLPPYCTPHIALRIQFMDSIDRCP